MRSSGRSHNVNKTMPYEPIEISLILDLVSQAPSYLQPIFTRESRDKVKMENSNDCFYLVYYYNYH